MKQLSKPSVFTSVCAGAGIAACFLRLWLFASGTDDKGLLVTSHPGNILSWLLTAAVIVLLILCLRGISRRCQFRTEPVTAAGFFVQSIGFGLAAWSMIAKTALVLNTAAAITGMLAAVCALAIGLFTWKGYRAHPLFFCPGILFFVFFLVCQYQHWSAEPEMQRYVFFLLASVLMMLSLYQRAALTTGGGNGTLYLFFSRGALFFCFAASVHSGQPVFLCAMGLSILLDGCTIPQKRVRSE